MSFRTAVKCVAIVVGVGLSVWSGHQVVRKGAELQAFGSPYGLQDLQFARDPDQARRVLESWAEPRDARLFDVARASLAYDYAFLIGYGLTFLALALLFRSHLRDVRKMPTQWTRSDLLARALHASSWTAAAAAVVAAGLDFVENLLHRTVLGAADGSVPTAGELTRWASACARVKFSLLVVLVLYLTVTGLYLLARKRGPAVKQFLAVVRITRFSLIAVGAVGAGLVLAPQLRDTFRLLAEQSLGYFLVVEVFLIFWALTVWYAARFLLNVDFEAEAFDHPSSPEAGFGPGADYWPGEDNWPRFLGASALWVVALACFLTWWEDDGYPWLLGLSAANAVLGGLFWWLASTRRHLLEKWLKRPPHPARGLAFRDMPGSVQWLVGGSLGAALGWWLTVFFFPEWAARHVGTLGLLLGGSIAITIAGSLLVWLGERTKLPAVSAVLLIAILFSYTNDNHHVRLLPDRWDRAKTIDVQEHLREWHAWIAQAYPEADEHPLFIVSASGGGIRAAYWTASVLTRLQDLNPAFTDHALLVSGISGGSLGALVFANLVTTTPGDVNWREGDRARFKQDYDIEHDGGSCALELDGRGKYQMLAQRILGRDFLAPVVASMLYRDLFARFLPMSWLSDRAEALETAWEQAWDVTREEERGRFPSLWPGNPFTRSFEVLYDHARVDPRRKPKSGQMPLIAVNGTLVESGKRLLTSHLKHPKTFSGDLENAFEHRRAWMPMSTAALMSARFTYVSPAGTLAPQTHVVDGGYFDNSGATTALQVWAEIEPRVRALNDRLVRHKVTPVYLQIDNDTPPRAGLGRPIGTPTPAREEYPGKYPRLLPEVSAPISALLGARTAHAVEAERRAKSKFGDRFVEFNTNRPDRDHRGLASAPLGWVLSETSRQTLSRQLCLNRLFGTFDKVLRHLPEH